MLTQNGTERAATQPFSGMDDRITAFCDAFNVLRKNFDTGLNLNAALVLSRTTVIANAISTYNMLLLSYWMFTDFCAQDVTNCCRLSKQWKCTSIIARLALLTLD
jgi:hypothetical protein